MDILLSFVPEILALLLALGVTYFKTSDKQLVRKVARKVDENDEEIVGAVRRVIDARDREKSTKP